MTPEQRHEENERREENSYIWAWIIIVCLLIRAVMLVWRWD